MTVRSPARVLVIEDEMLVAMSIEDALENAGFVVAAIVARVEDAMSALAQAGNFDAAVMDLNLAGSSGVPVAERLAELGIPFLIVSGYGWSGLPAHLANIPLLPKPFEPDRLGNLMRSLMTTS